MKKVYSKPMLVFESFELTASIAAGCEHKANYSDVNSCVYEYEGWKLFISAKDCEEGSDTVASELVCYHNPTESNNVFGS